MAVIKYDVTDVPEGGGGEQPQPGMYKGKIVSVTPRKKNAKGDPCNDLEVVVDVGKEFSRLWTYIQLDNPASAWKLREFTDAMGLPPKGGIDPVKLAGKKVNVKVAADVDLDGDYRGKVKNLFAPTEGGSDDDDDDNAGGGEDYSEWSLEDLEAEIETRGLAVPKGRKTADKLIAVLEEDDAATGGDGDGDDDNNEDDTPTDEYDDWTLEDLQGEAEEKGILGNISGRKTKEKLIEALRALNDGPGGGGDDEPTDDYDDWEEQELLDEIETRNNEANAEIEIKGRKTKDKLIAALREDDASAEPF